MCSVWQAGHSRTAVTVTRSAKCYYRNTISSVQFSCSVVSDSLRPHESQHARPPCPSPTPEFTQTHIHRVSDAIQHLILYRPQIGSHNPDTESNLKSSTPRPNLFYYPNRISLDNSVVKNPPAMQETRFWVGKTPWRRKWQLTPVFLPGKSYGQRSLAGY